MDQRHKDKHDTLNLKYRVYLTQQQNIAPYKRGSKNSNGHGLSNSSITTDISIASKPLDMANLKGDVLNGNSNYSIG
jgi:hypothetical protein